MELFGLSTGELVAIGIVCGIFVIAVAREILKRKQMRIAKTMPPPPRPSMQQHADADAIERAYNQHRMQHVDRPMDHHTLFPNIHSKPINGDEMQSRINNLGQIASSIRSQQDQMSQQSDNLLDNLQEFVGKMDAVKKQYMQLAEIIDTQYQIIEFELEAKQRILEYHLKNKKRRNGLAAEIDEMNKKAEKEPPKNNTSEKPPR